MCIPFVPSQSVLRADLSGDEIFDFLLLAAASLEINYKYYIKISLSIRSAHGEPIKMIIDCSLNLLYCNGKHLNRLN